MDKMYQAQLQAILINKIEELCPKLVKELKKDILAIYQKAFPNYSEIVRYETLIDVIEEAEWYKTQFENLAIDYPKDKVNIEFLPSTLDFAKSFNAWLKSWNSDTQWLADLFLRLLFIWKSNPKRVEGHLIEGLIVAYFPLPKFNFIFRAQRKNEPRNIYLSALKESFNQELSNHLTAFDKRKKFIPDIRSELTHIEWFVDYQFNKKSFKKISMQEELRGVNRGGSQAISQAVDKFSELLRIPRRSRNKKST